MALEGPLRELALTDVLQLLAQSRKTGELQVRREGEQQEAAVFLEDGAVVGISGSARTRRLGELLLLSGKVAERQIAAALEEQRGSPETPLGTILVTSHGVLAEDIRKQLRFQVEELVFDLARLADGYFRFEEHPPLVRGEITIRIAVDSLLLETARRMDELAAIQHQHPDPVPRLLEVSPTGSPLDLDPVDWEILTAVDGQRDLGQIARELGRSELEVAKAVFSLVSEGVVALANRRGPSLRTADEDGLMAIERAIESQRYEEAEALLRTALANGASGEEVLLAGRLDAARGRWGSALERFQEAISRDPLLANAHAGLGVAAIRSGQLGLAEEALGTTLRLLGPTSSRRVRLERLARAVGELRAALQEVEG
ncbi:hypothetical protein BH23GEM6_BH23GEM6_16750 [soil metagenome]